MAIATLTVLPEAPVRTSPKTFPARADAFCGGLVTLQSEINALIPAIEQAYTNTAASTLTEWVTATAYVYPDCRAGSDGHSYRCWTGHTSSATDEPGTGVNWKNYWVRISPIESTNGVDIVNSAVDVTLTTNSLRIQSVTMTAADKYVGMIAATSLEEGGIIHGIYNDGDYAFMVRDGSLNMLCALLPKQFVILFLEDNSTVAGTWVLSGNYQEEYIYSTSTALTASAVADSILLRTGDTAFVYLWRISTTTFKAVAWTEASGVGTAVTIKDSAGTVDDIAGDVIVPVTENVAKVLAIRNDPAVGNFAYVLTVTGNAIVVGAEQDLSIVGTRTRPALLARSATKAVLVEDNTTDLFVNLLDISGDTVASIASDTDAAWADYARPMSVLPVWAESGKNKLFIMDGIVAGHGTWGVAVTDATVTLAASAGTSYLKDVSPGIFVLGGYPIGVGNNTSTATATGSSEFIASIMQDDNDDDVFLEETYQEIKYNPADIYTVANNADENVSLMVFSALNTYDVTLMKATLNVTTNELITSKGTNRRISITSATATRFSLTGNITRAIFFDSYTGAISGINSSSYGQFHLFEVAI